jgi:hypothetical protein
MFGGSTDEIREFFSLLVEVPKDLDTEAPDMRMSAEADSLGMSHGLTTSHDGMHEVFGADRMSVSSFVVCFTLPEYSTSSRNRNPVNRNHLPPSAPPPPPTHLSGNRASFHNCSHFPALNFLMAASMSFARTSPEDR